MTNYKNTNKSKSNKQFFFGIVGGLLMFTVPVLVDLYVRPILHTLY
jgi:hypothetical protein